MEDIKMKTDSSNTWLVKDSEESRRQVNYYTSSKDVIMIERKRTTRILLDLFRYHFDTATSQRILDIGCGDGEMAFEFKERFPGNEFYLMDGSEDMLAKAKVKLKGDNIFLIQKTFENYILEESEPSKFNLIYSSNAIHHLDFLSKSQLYNKIYRELVFDGMFINIDLVLPPSQLCEELQFQMWVDWINETLTNNDLKSDVGKHNGLPEIYKSKAENQPSNLFDQLEVLRKCGFRNVDCFYKYGIFAMFGGIK